MPFSWILGFSSVIKSRSFFGSSFGIQLTNFLCGLGAVLFGNCFQKLGNQLKNHRFIDTVLGLAQYAHWDFAVLGTSVLGNSFAVVGAVNIHLAAAIGTV